MTGTTTQDRTAPPTPLAAAGASTRLEAALHAGTEPRPDQVGTLVARCGVEPDPAVRDMLTWALTRHEPSQVVPLLLHELRSPVARARAQALHTLSKIRPPEAWPQITPDLLHDADDDVARAAWRAAVALVPPGQEAALAHALAAQLGRGDLDTRSSLSRALAALGDAGRAAVADAGPDPEAQAHAAATLQLIDDPEASVGALIHEARRVLALRDAPTVRD